MNGLKVSVGTVEISVCPEFGEKVRQVDGKIWELPITLHSLSGLRVPIAGGVYFRVLPFALTQWAVRRKIQQGEPVGSYLHPYDIDTKQERFMHPDLNEKRHLNMLMYIGRAQVLKRLAVLSRSCFLMRDSSLGPQSRDGIQFSGFMSRVKTKENTNQ